MLLDHLASGGAGRDEARPDHGLQRHKELVDQQGYGQFGASVVFGERASGVEDNVDLAVFSPTSSIYRLTAASSSVSTTAVCGLPPDSAICLATLSDST